jgi:hypothetical protein
MENGEQKNPVTRTAFYVRVTTQEYVRVLKMAEATRKNPQELFKRALLDRMDLERPIYLMQPEQAAEFGIELKRQGNNVNQIAFKFNQGLMSGWSQALSGIYAAYVRLERMLEVNRANR